MHVGEEAADVMSGDAVYIPPGSVQWLENSGYDDVEFVCIVDPAWRPEDEQVL
jgi:mannose-6-phosphate isomerase-like protein (cupin superfamily)